MSNNEPPTIADPDSSSDEEPMSDNNSDSESCSDPDSDSNSNSDVEFSDDLDKPSLNSTRPPDTRITRRRREQDDYIDEDDGDDDCDDPEKNYKDFASYFKTEAFKKKMRDMDGTMDKYKDPYKFPEDPEEWEEKDNGEIWDDPPLGGMKPGFDPNWMNPKEWNAIRNEFKAGKIPSIAPFYVPYRKPFPVEFRMPKASHVTEKEGLLYTIEALDRVEEFLQWVSYVFIDGSTYEGTVWDDVAQGKGVYTSPEGLVRYEGEWLRNAMEGHGVVEVEIPDYQPVPGSRFEREMREKGQIISTDFMIPDDRRWLKMDINDSVISAGREYEVPFYENKEWIRQFGSKPETGRYRYAGQWKHGRMHGCGVYEVNERTLYGRFYFGQLADNGYGCNSNTSALHAGIAEVAAAKARMFLNKPDGMVREERGPYNDPQHPYFYEEDDVWMAPGFINQFYEVPDYWKAYVHDVDEEREMWINSFYKAPLRLPMPAELEHWWSKEEDEFILVNQEPEPDPEDPSQLIYSEDPIIIHTPTGRVINFVEDEEYGVRLFWQPSAGFDNNLDEPQFLPLGFDEFYGRAEIDDVEESKWAAVLRPMKNVCKAMLDKLEKWTEEKRKASETRTVLIEKELDLVDAEITLKETSEDMDEELRRLQIEEEEKLEKGLQEEEDIVISTEKTSQLDEILPVKVENEEEENEVAEEAKGKEEVGEEEGEGEEEEDEEEPPSFGSIIDDQEDPTKNDTEEKKNGKSPFAASSLPFASCGLTSVVPSQLQQSFLKWKESRSSGKISSPFSLTNSCWVSPEPHTSLDSVSFSWAIDKCATLRARRRAGQQVIHITKLCRRSLSKRKIPTNFHRNAVKHKAGSWIWQSTDPIEEPNILSLHTCIS